MRTAREDAAADARPRLRLVGADEGERRRRSRARPRPRAVVLPADQVLLVALVAVLCVVGLVMVLSASSVEALSRYGSPWYVFERQVLWVVVGVVLAVAGWRINYHLWERVGGPLLLVCLVLLVAVIVPGLGTTVSGGSRWLGIGGLSFQPSEITKLAIVTFGAGVLSRRVGQGRTWDAVRPVVFALAITAALILKQPDMGTTLVLACITLGLLCAAGVPAKWIGGTVGILGGGAFLLALARPYRRARLLSFLNPWAHRAGSGYQEVQSLIGFANGHFLGVGLGASTAKWGFLPNAHTDFIFSIIGEELGLVGSLLVVALFVALALVGLRISARAPDRFGSLLAAGVTCWLTCQALLNMGAVIGLLPVTGVPLPFVSYGGSSLVFEMAAVGILLNVARRSRARAPRVPLGREDLAPWPPAAAGAAASRGAGSRVGRSPRAAAGGRERWRR